MSYFGDIMLISRLRNRKNLNKGIERGFAVSCKDAHLYYFDLETEGEDPKQHGIITIQYAKLCLEDSQLEPLSNIEILKVWERGSEKELIEKFLEVSEFFNCLFCFIPVGVALIFDILFLCERAKIHGLLDKDLDCGMFLHEKPLIDFKPIFILLNDFRFKDWNKLIDRFMRIGISSRDVPELYKSRDFNKIIDYIIDEFKATLEAINNVIRIFKPLPKQ